MNESGVKSVPPLRADRSDVGTAGKSTEARLQNRSGASDGASVLTDQMREWLRSYESFSPDERAKAMVQGVEVAKSRRDRLKRLILEDPEEALAQSLRWDEIQRLPEQVRGFVEAPFSELADFTRVPVCPGTPLFGGGGRVESVGKLEFSNGTRLEAYATGGRRDLGSKKEVPVQGIALDGIAAVRGGVFQILKHEEVETAVSRFGGLQSDSVRSFATGEPISGKPVVALAGGRVFSFASEDELLKLDKALVQLDLKPGPRAGSRAIFARPYAADGSGTPPAFNLEDAEMAALSDSQAWTTTPKSVFLIRVDFSDLPGAPVTKADAEAVLNGVVHTSLSDMSYGKAGVSAAASAKLYRVAGGTASYSGNSGGSSVGASFTSNNDALLAAAKAAFNAGKAGSADASVDLTQFDVVGVSFADIGCYNSGVKYAGLASISGGDLWMQGSNEGKVYVHELGHVYGLGHSNFWQTSDGSVVGTGEEREYGDDYDVMGKGSLPKGHFHPQAKQKLFWLSSDQWIDASAAGVSKVYRIYRHDDPLTTGSLRGVRITKQSQGVAGAEYYWIGYRAAYTDNARLTGGAYLLWQRPGAVKSCLIDTTPVTSGDKTDAGLDIGRTYEDVSSQIRITPLARGGSGSDQYLDVQVSLGVPANNHQPAVSLAGGSNVSARTPAVFSVNATDADGDTLSYFWDAGDGVVSGGTNGASTLSHAWTMGGTYRVSVTVSDMKGGVDTKSVSVVVEDEAQKFVKRDIGLTRDLNGVAASDSLLVAVGDGGSGGADPNVIRTSPDGVVWTPRPVAESTLNLKLKSVVWDGMRFVAVGEDYEGSGRKWYGVVYISETGFEWRRAFETNGVGTSLNVVCAGAGKIVAGGDAQTLLVSTDGVNWASVSLLPSGYAVGGLAYGNSNFALTAHGEGFGYADGLVYTSSDGVSWIDRTAGAGLDSKTDLRTIAYLNGRFIGSGWFSKLKASSDSGLSFSTTRLLNEEAAVLTYGSGLYFAAGLLRSGSGNSTSTTGVNLYSQDGISWSGTAAASGTGARNGGVFFNGRILTVGDGGEIWHSGTVQLGGANLPPVIEGGSLVLQSTVNARSNVSFGVSASDGNDDVLRYNWDAGDGTSSNTGRFFTHRWAVGGTYTVKVTVTDGKGGSVTKADVLNVADPLQTFSKRAIGSTNNFNSVAASGSIAVAVGDKGGVWTSVDGSSWADRTIAPSANLYLQSIVWDGSRFTAVGNDVDQSYKFFTGTVYTSPDGIGWTRRYLGTSEFTEFRAVASSGGTLLAGGAYGTLMRSTNGGVSWAPVTAPWLPSTHTVTGLGYGDATFVLSAHDENAALVSEIVPLVYTSPDGVNWTNSTQIGGTNTTADFCSLAYLNDRFVGGGVYSKLRFSTNRGATFSTNRTALESTPALAFGNGVYFAAGSDSSNSRVHVVSTDGSSWSCVRAPAGVTADEKGAAFFKNSFIVVGDGGFIAQSGTVLAASQPLQILSQPQDLSVLRGGSAVLSVSVTGSGPLTYEWRKEGAPIANATEPVYRIGSASVADAGSYAVKIVDAQGGTTLLSGSAHVSVTSSGAGLVTQQPAASMSVVKGSSATAAIAVGGGSSGSDPVLRTVYQLYALGSSPAKVGVEGVVPASGVIEVPLRSVVSYANYFVRVTRTYASGAQDADDTQSFLVNPIAWDSLAGSYEVLLSAGTASGTVLGDGAVYRGLLAFTLSKIGSLSGKLSYNEAIPVHGGTLGERYYQPVTRSFTGVLAPKVKGGLVFTVSPKLGTGVQAGREELRLEVDMGAGHPVFAAVLLDKVSVVTAGTCMSFGTASSRVSSSLGASFSGVAGRYTLSANGGSASAGYEHQAYVAAQVLNSGKMLWTSRLKGVSGSGSASVNLGGAAQPTAEFYEGRSSGTATLNTFSLLGRLSFQQLSGGSWRAAFGSQALADGVEKQASYLSKAVVAGSAALVPVLSPAALASGTQWTGVKVARFSDGDGSRWAGATSGAMPSFFPQAQNLTLALLDPVSGSAFSWTVTVQSSGVAGAVSVAGAPTMSLRLDRGTGVLTGSYVYLGVRRSLVGVALEPPAGSRCVARGWAEAAGSSGLKAASWELTK